MSLSNSRRASSPTPAPVNFPGLSPGFVGLRYAWIVDTCVSERTPGSDSILFTTSFEFASQHESRGI